MLVNDKLFYSQYLKEYHTVKAHYLNLLLEQDALLKERLAQEEFLHSLRENTGFIIQADIRQNMFHAIETFFELFFAFLPDKGAIPNHHQIIRSLSKANWRKNYKTLTDIANGKFSLDILDEEINFLNHKISVAHYLFHPGIFNSGNFPKEVFESINAGVPALKYAIKHLAMEFENREEYNAYKHANRIFPTYKSIHFVAVDDMQEKLSIDLSNSVSYYTYDDNADKVTISTKAYDSERDTLITRLCGNLIYPMIFYRDVMINKENYAKDQPIAIGYFYNLESVKNCFEHRSDTPHVIFSSQQLKPAGLNIKDTCKAG